MFLFAYKFADSNDVTLSELENSFEELRQDLFERKKRDFKFSGSSKNVLNHAIDLLHPYLEVIFDELPSKSSVQILLSVF